MLSNTRLAAMEKTAQYYISLYGDDPATKVTREHFAMKDNTLPDLQARKDLAKFFFWTAWTASCRTSKYKCKLYQQLANMSR